jgi:hypothetical protein
LRAFKEDRFEPNSRYDVAGTTSAGPSSRRGSDGGEKSAAMVEARRDADCQSAIQQTDSLRYRFRALPGELFQFGFNEQDSTP